MQLDGRSLFKRAGGRLDRKEGLFSGWRVWGSGNPFQITSKKAECFLPIRRDFVSDDEEIQLR
jgi:hypothetical protein